MVEKDGTSRRYLKMLGVASMIFAGFTLVAGMMFLLMRSNSMIVDLGLEESFREMLPGMSEDSAKTALGVSIILSALLEMVVGWLLIRGSNEPKKTTVLLVLLVLEVISGVYAMFSGGFSNILVVLGNIVNLTLYVLGLLALLDVRKSVE